MKILSGVLLAIAGIIVMMSLHSCSKTNTNSAAADSAFMKATVQGLAFSAKGAGGAYAGSSTSGGINTLTIYGVSTNGQAITIALNNNAGVGVTYFASTGGSAYYYPSGGLLGSYSYAVSGSVTLTQTTPGLKGTFSFVTTDNQTIGAGSFSVPAP